MTSAVTNRATLRRRRIPVPATGFAVLLLRLDRYPHQWLLRPWSAQDQASVENALRRTGTDTLRDHQVDRLSGGQRQRAWIAMALAQDTDLLLDEPAGIFDADLVRAVFGVDCRVIPDPETGTPLVVPRARSARHTSPAGRDGARPDHSTARA